MSIVLHANEVVIYKTKKRGSRIRGHVLATVRHYCSLWAQSQSHPTRNRTLCERLLDNGAFHYKVLFTLRCSISDLINILLGCRRLLALVKIISEILYLP